MKNKVFFAISVRIVFIFAIAMMATFLPEYLRDFFGDTLHVCSDKCKYSCSSGVIDNSYHWGARHYWYYWMMFILFLLSVLNLVLSIRNVVIKNYDTSQW